MNKDDFDITKTFAQHLDVMVKAAEASNLPERHLQLLKRPLISINSGEWENLTSAQKRGWLSWISDVGFGQCDYISSLSDRNLVTQSQYESFCNAYLNLMDQLK